MTDSIEPSLGTVSSGTLKVDDLLIAALAEAAFHGLDVGPLYAEAEDVLERIAYGFETDDDLEAIGFLIDDVYDALNDACSLPNVYYGAHPGDGADIGWWEYSGP